MLKKIVKFRLDEDSFNQFIKTVNLAGQTPSEWLRELVNSKVQVQPAANSNLKEIPPRQKRKKAGFTESELMLIRQISWIGNNINQIAYAINDARIKNKITASLTKEMASRLQTIEYKLNGIWESYKSQISADKSTYE